MNFNVFYDPDMFRATFLQKDFKDVWVKRYYVSEVGLKMRIKAFHSE